MNNVIQAVRWKYKINESSSPSSHVNQTLIKRYVSQRYIYIYIYINNYQKKIHFNTSIETFWLPCEVQAHFSIQVSKETKLGLYSFKENSPPTYSKTQFSNFLETAGKTNHLFYLSTNRALIRSHQNITKEGQNSEISRATSMPSSHWRAPQ